MKGKQCELHLCLLQTLQHRDVDADDNLNPHRGVVNWWLDGWFIG